MEGVIRIPHVDLAVIGSGAGLIVLEAALKKGLTCALIEKDKFGGTCLNRGCIPTKMLVYPADLVREAQRGERLGVSFPKPDIDWGRISQRVWQQIDANIELRQGYLNTPNLLVLEGTGAFVDKHTLRVELNQGGTTTLTADTILVAAGGRSVLPPIQGLQEADCLTYENFFGDRYPKQVYSSLAIIGGGVIGVEFAHIFSSLGSKVTVIGRAPQLLRGEEEESARLVQSQLKENGVSLLLGHEAVRIEKRDGIKRVISRCMETGVETAVEAQEVLIASGTRPNSDLVQAENAGIALDSHGGILLNEYLQTNVPHIYALGDITGKMLFRHKANYEAQLLADNLYLDKPLRKADYTAVPMAAFTAPQLASVGLTEKQAQEQGIPYQVLRNSYGSIAAGFSMGYSAKEQDAGFIKVLVGENDKLLGVHVAGYQAAALIQPYVYLMNAYSGARYGSAIRLIQQSMTIHPSLSELTAWAFENY